MTWKKSLLILFATVMVAFVPISAYAAVDDGNLRKITSDGQYDIGMSWQPAGPLQPGIDYLFNFEIREGMSQKSIDDASFNFQYNCFVEINDRFFQSNDSLMNRSVFWQLDGCLG